MGLLLAAQVAVALVGRSPGPLAPLVRDDLFPSKAQADMFPAAAVEERRANGGAEPDER